MGVKTLTSAMAGGAALTRWQGNSPVIYIDTVSRRLRLVQGGRVLYDFSVAVGKPTTPTPAGSYRILEKTMNPGGPFGTRWMRFTDRAHGIHGTNEPWLIGQAVSNGCVRMYNEDVELLYDLVSIGTPVVVTA
ncbi:MAG: L,D-transpeptidase [Firmicutes bacterium]|jgi:L,D-transpeptidase ErfK/SrfK|nr:L,D-transpeptidase [Bacillota bacterium]